MEIYLKFVKDILVGVSGKLISILISKKKANSSISENLITNQKIEEVIIVKEPSRYSRELGQRFTNSVELMKLNNHTLTYSKICDHLNYKSVSLVEKYFSGEMEASKKFIKKYCDFYGIEYEWLRHGDKNPFQLRSRYVSRIADYREDILNLNAKAIFYVRSGSQNGKSGIVIKLSDQKYLSFPSTFNVSSHVGGEGRKQIVSFYELIKSLTSTFSFFQTFGLILTEEEFNDLFNGRIYPQKVFESNIRCLHWWDDLLDIYHKNPISADYEKMYGLEFLKAQEIIKREIEKKVA